MLLIKFWYIGREKLSNESQQKYLDSSHENSGWLEKLNLTPEERWCETRGDNPEIVAQRLSKISLSEFWPLNLDVIKLNQKLGILGISQEVVEDEEQLKELVILLLE